MNRRSGMKFYILSNEMGGVVGCERTLSAAFKLAESYGLTRYESRIDAIDVAVNAETVRRLLVDTGGYAKSIKRVWGS
jgi:hypothetical protein